MRNYPTIIFTLATLAASNTTQQAVAEPIKVDSKTETSQDVVVPTQVEKGARVDNTAPPQPLLEIEFSQNQITGKKTVKNNNITQKKIAPTAQVNNSVVIQNTPTKPVIQAQKIPVKNQSKKTPSTQDLVVTATDVKVLGVTQELQKIIRSTIRTQPGGQTSQSQLQQDVQAILETGLFANAKVNSSSTKDGLSVVYQVQPITVRSLQLNGAKALTYQVVNQYFSSQIGKPISPQILRQGVEKINKWYADNDYKLARVLSIKPNRQGILTMNVAEGVVGDIEFSFVNDDDETVDKKGKPIKGRTKPDFLKKQIKLQPGQIFQEKLVRQDVQRLYGTGLFSSVNIALEGDANQVKIVYKLKELGARSVNLGGNYNGDQGVVGTLSYRDRNVRGNNNALGVDVKVGRRHLGFDTKFTSPYRPSNPDRLGYTINVFRRRGLAETLDDSVRLPNGDKVRKGEIGASLSFQRPIEGWDTSLGFNYTRISIRDRKGKVSPKDSQGNPLSLSNDGIDNLATVSFSATKDRRNNRFNPTNGSILQLSTEQSIPMGLGNVSMNRLKANYSQFKPVNLFKSDKPQVFAVNVQAGTVIGDLASYDTFNLGGSNSVRGYGSGDIGNARTYVLASAEYRFPVFKAMGGVVFADFASNLGSGNTIVGSSTGTNSQPGTGFGYGAGLRFNSPLGLLRADYGINDRGESKLHFGIGHRF
ncbi:MAG: BamA/TamA family outer membrane protein [Calothrix sp. MO_192.B10]|nr:BamA/TamA family outer membrane protein [Calothrix sp. MO_192.B10]